MSHRRQVLVARRKTQGTVINRLKKTDEVLRGTCPDAEAVDRAIGLESGPPSKILEGRNIFQTDI